MSGQRWAISPTDQDAHLLLVEQRVPGQLMARCAAVLPPDVHQFDHPPGPRLCPSCWIIARARLKSETAGRPPVAAGQLPPTFAIAPGGRPVPCS